MTLTKTNIGTNEDGTPRFHYASDQPLMVVGPIVGTIQTKDGTSYDVTDDVIEVQPHHIQEVNHLIGARYETEGHPLDATFVHDCTVESCGKLKGRA